MGNFIGYLRWYDKTETNPMGIIEDQIHRLKQKYRGRGETLKSYEEQINLFLLQNLNSTGTAGAKSEIIADIEGIMQRLGNIQVSKNLNVTRQSKIKLNQRKRFTDNFIATFGKVMQDLNNNNIAGANKEMSSIMQQAKDLQREIEAMQAQTPGARKSFVFTENYMDLAELISQYSRTEFLYGVGEAAEIALSFALQGLDEFAYDKTRQEAWELLGAGKRGSNPMINLQGISDGMQKKIQQTAGKQWVLDSDGSTLTFNRSTFDKADLIIHPREGGNPISASVKSYWQGAAGTIHFAGAGAGLLPILSDELITNNFNTIYLSNLYHNRKDMGIEKLAEKVLILLNISGGLRQQFSADTLIVLNRSALNSGENPVKIFSISELAEKILSNSSDNYVNSEYVGSITRSKGVTRFEYFQNLLSVKVTAEIKNLQKLIDS